MTKLATKVTKYVNHLKNDFAEWADICPSKESMKQKFNSNVNVKTTKLYATIEINGKAHSCVRLDGAPSKKFKEGEILKPNDRFLAVSRERGNVTKYFDHITWHGTFERYEEPKKAKKTAAKKKTAKAA